MPDIIALRRRVGALLARRAAIAACIDELDAIGFKVEPRMERPEIEYDEFEEAVMSGSGPRPEVGEVVSITSRVGLYCLCGSPSPGDRGDWSLAGNLAGHMEGIRKLSRGPERAEAGGEPSLAGLTGFEVGAIVSAYAGLVERLTEALRDVGTHMIYVRRGRTAMPAALRNRCIGMFGRPDFETGFEYGERDFAPNATEHRQVPREDPDDPRGPYRFEMIDHHPPVLGGRALAPVIGDGPARRVDELLATIEAEAAPRPGEPDLVTFFGSHVSNRIAIAYEPGEIDVPAAAEAA